MQSRHFEAIIFSAKAAISAVIGALCYKFFNLPGAPWAAAVSAVIVSQPNLHSSLRASLMRVMANLAGAFGGAALIIIIGQPLVAMAVGVMLAGFLCHLLKQDDALRPAFVAVVLVTLIDENRTWSTPLYRVIGVITGCACALVIGFLFDKLSGGFKSSEADDGKKTDLAE